MILEWGAGVGALAITELYKSQQIKLDEQTKAKIEQEGLYHFTTKETAEAVVSSGFLLPTVGLEDNHLSKKEYSPKENAELVYMFAGKPTKNEYDANLNHRPTEDGTFYAVRYRPNKFEMENLRSRLEDGAITHEDRMDLYNGSAELVRLMMHEGQMVEIPWDQELDLRTSFQKTKFSKTLAGRLILSAKPVSKELWNNVKNIKNLSVLRQHVAERRMANRELAQYNLTVNPREFNIENGEDFIHIVSSPYARVIDGKKVNEFVISQPGSEKTKSAFMDVGAVSSFDDKSLEDFFQMTINSDFEHNQYIGKPVRVDGILEQEIDDEFAHNFAMKEVHRARNQELADNMLEERREIVKGKSTLGQLQKLFEKVKPNKRKEAVTSISTMKTREKTIQKEQDDKINDGEADGR